MEKYYDGALVMPKTYAVVDEEEMTYVDGGKYYSKTVTVSVAKSYFGKVAGIYAGGVGTSAYATPACPPLFAITDLFFAYSAWRAMDCFNKVSKWEHKYGPNRACKVGINVVFKYLVTGVDVELLKFNIHGGGGGHF